MENGAFAPKEQMLHFPYYFQIHDISKASKGINIELRVKLASSFLSEKANMQVRLCCFFIDGHAYRGFCFCKQHKRFSPEVTYKIQ